MVGQGVAFNCSRLFYSCGIGTDGTIGGVVATTLIKTVLHNTVTRLVVEGGSDSDIFPSLGISLLATIVRLARR